VLSIGPAGENLVSFACVGSERYRQAGRGGVGSVMGSKKLKAIVCSGSQSVSVPDMPRLLKLVKKLTKEDVYTDDNLWVYETGTSAIVDMSNSAEITRMVYSRAPQRLTRIASRSSSPRRRLALPALWVAEITAA